MILFSTPFVRPRSRLAHLVTMALAVCLAPLARVAQAQAVAIAPGYVIVDGARRQGDITFSNTGPSTVQVRITLVYGYHGTDSSGANTVFRPDVPPDTSTSALGVIERFSRSCFRLAPGAGQRVIVQAVDPEHVRPGERWGRLVVTQRVLRPGAPQLCRERAVAGDSAAARSWADSGAVEGEVSAGLQMDFEAVLPLLYRLGPLATGLTVAQTESRLLSGPEGLRVRTGATLKRVGNAAFIGTAHVDVLDAAGRVRASGDFPHATYFTTDPRWTLAVRAGTDLTGGRVRVSLRTERAGLPRGVLVRSSPITFETPIVLPGGAGARAARQP